MEEGQEVVGRRRREREEAERQNLALQEDIRRQLAQVGSQLVPISLFQLEELNNKIRKAKEKKKGVREEPKQETVPIIPKK